MQICDLFDLCPAWPPDMRIRENIVPTAEPLAGLSPPSPRGGRFERGAWPARGLTVHSTVVSFSLFFSRMDEKTTSRPLPSSSRSRAIQFVLLGGTLLLGGGAVNLFHVQASDRDPSSSSYGKCFDPAVCEGSTGNAGEAMEDSGCSKVGGVSTHIPFFGSADDDTMSKSWSHLNHRVEEYRDDLVQVVEVSTRH